MPKPIIAKTALNKITNDYLPYKWDLNIYRGCIHSCHYCYALYSHKYLESDQFFDDIYVKTNIAELLEQKLRSRYWQKSLINLGGVTDSYQPAEADYKIMPEILKVMIKYRNPITISTKSDLILRDYDLIAELARYTAVNVACTIITTDDDTRKIVEPHASPIAQRVSVLKAFQKTKVSTGMHTMPILPYITDQPENFENLFALAKECEVDYVLTEFLNLRSQTRKHFLSFIQTQFPEFYADYLKLYKGWLVDKTYKSKIYTLISSLKAKYRIPKYTDRPVKNFLDQQLGLF